MIQVVTMAEEHISALAQLEKECFADPWSEKALAEEKSWVLRFRSEGNAEKYLHLNDLVKGKIDMPENDQDIVLLKSDGIPTYHFAHAVDDHLMRTTHVIRAEEWLSSVPKHIAIFKACGFKVPKYAHLSQVMKLDEDDGNKRKISKRKDPEAAVSYFFEAGFPTESILEYLFTLINSNFEEWRRANPKENLFAFPFNLKKMSPSGCLFDLVKLNDVSKNVISVMTAEAVYNYIANWAEKFDEDFFKVFTQDPDRSKAMVNIDRESPKPRKDIAKWSEVKEYFAYMFDAYFTPDFDLPENIAKEDAKAILEMYKGAYDDGDDKDMWFQRIKDMCEPLGFTPNVKEYKQNPDGWKGHVGDVSMFIRVAVTGKLNSPDMYAVMQILGRDKVNERIDAMLNTL